MRYFDQAISLGPDCQTAFQIRRIFGKPLCPSGIFDSQVTPLSALLAYIESDFCGMFNRDDLRATDWGVINTKYQTVHPHEFADGNLENYGVARKRHDYLCAKIRRAIQGSTRTVFIFHSLTPREDEVQMRRVLRSVNPNGRFDVLAVEARPELPPSYPSDIWCGNDEHWDTALANIRIRRSATGVLRRQISRISNHVLNVYERCSISFGASA